MTVKTRDVLVWLGLLLKPYRLKVVGAIVALFVAAGTWLGLGQALKMGVDNSIANQTLDAINHAALIVLALSAVACIATYVRFYLMTWLGERVTADIRTQVYQHLLTLPPAFFAKTRTGEVISRFTNDTGVIQSVIGMGLSMAIRSTVTFIGALILMLISSPMLTGCVLLAVPVILVPLRVIAPKVRRYARLSQDKIADLGAQIDETLHEIHVVQAFTAEQRENAFFSRRIYASLAAAAKRIHYRSLLIMVIMLVSLVAIITIAWIGARQVHYGSLSVGELTAFLFYAVMAGSSIATVSEVIGEVQRGVGASERLLELLGTSNPLEDGATASIPAPLPPQIQFDHVEFGYDNHPALFSDFTLSISSGECVALVGASGAGKSTLFQLLSRFYDVQQGRILINQTPINTLSLRALRQLIATVPQEPVIFATSVLENIRYGREDATEEEVIKAATDAYAIDFIQELPDGLQTQLGERGVNLSGGQRQRIAIARALLADRPILLLDEATSALDAVSEHKVQQALDVLMQGRTTLVIAHRLATVKHADRIVVMENGRLVAAGNHESLLKSDTVYKEYAELQLLS